jgi:hypothetical protein
LWAGRGAGKRMRDRKKGAGFIRVCRSMGKRREIGEKIGEGRISRRSSIKGIRNSKEMEEEKVDSGVDSIADRRQLIKNNISSSG